VLEAVCGGGGAGVHRGDGRAGRVVEIDEGLITPLGAVIGERDGVGQLLGSCLEWSARKEEGNVAGGVCVVPGVLPSANADAALSGKETGVGRGFGHRTAAREHQQRGELALRSQRVAVEDRDVDEPRAFEALVGGGFFGLRVEGDHGCEGNGEDGERDKAGEDPGFRGC
jgi:hypothetical protein